MEIAYYYSAAATAAAAITTALDNRYLSLWSECYANVSRLELTCLPNFH